MSVLSPSEANCPAISTYDIQNLNQRATGYARHWPNQWSPDGLFRNAVLRRLRYLDRGRLTIIDNDQAFEFGRHQSMDLHSTISIRDRRAYRCLATGGSLGAAEAYLEGLWDCEDLVTFFRFMLRNQEVLRRIDRGWARLRAPVRWAAKYLDRNTKRGSRRNIAAHYDLSNNFFALFLDKTMTYSSGIFEHPLATLREASIAKYDRLCRRLDLKWSDHLLEIGTGWGGFAIHAAENYGCQVTTTTISREQHDYARREIEKRGLEDRIALLLRDYRDLEGTFSKIVSIEMVEAVGHDFLKGYFQKCSELLKSGGRFALQAITIRDDHFARYRQSTDFIQRYVFPGGCLPSVGSLDQAAAATGDFRLRDHRDFGSHYATTIDRWRRGFRDNLDAVRGLGFDERFIRMWNYYLCYCEAGFREGQIGLAQQLYQKH